MKFIKITTITFAAATSLLLISCGEKKAPVDSANTEQADVTPYPLDICVVSGEKLGSMGEPHVFVHNGQQIKQCCDSCEPKFKKNPEKYLKMIKEGKTGANKHMHKH